MWSVPDLWARGSLSPRRPRAKHVVLYEPQEVPSSARASTWLGRLARACRAGRLSREEAERMIDRVLYTTRFEDLSGADGVIEADQRGRSRSSAPAFARSTAPRPTRVLASNTSSDPDRGLARERRDGPGRVARPALLLAGAGDAARRGRDRALETSVADGRRRPRRVALDDRQARRSGPRTAPVSSSTCCWSRT